ncbi:hypothetical protein [Microbacterium sp. A93]|uniref:hypothetical protein n=1 Tax=Microbacterium sp. A93 TaxID=3450716 RepID=UPI003F431977
MEHEQHQEIFQASIFTVAEATDAGFTQYRLRDARLTSPTRGIRMWDGATPPWFETLRAYSGLEGEHYLSHTTAAQIWGLWVPFWLKIESPIHITGRKGATGARRRPEVVGHRATLDPRDVVEVDGLRLTTPARTWLDVAPMLRDPFDLVAAGDALLQRADGPDRPEGVLGANPLASLPEIDEVLGRRRSVKGIQAAREARGMLRAGVDSAPESRMRSVILAAGLPEPVVNQEVRLPDGRVKRPDLHYLRWRIALQYEGEGHAGRVQLNKDIHRDDAFAANDWITVRAGHDLYTMAGERQFLDRLRRAIAQQSRRFG